MQNWDFWVVILDKFQAQYFSVKFPGNYADKKRFNLTDYVNKKYEKKTFP